MGDEMQLFLFIASIALIIYAIAYHRSGSRKKFYLIAYWNNLTPKGTVIYTIGVILLVYSVLFYH
jgi:hypothetical protein